jgi:calcineurin-like phosphoesterase family protein
VALWFTSDTHFSDPRVLRIDRRPFSSLAAHDLELITRWNAAVGPDDTVWHLGDLGRGSASHIARLLASLNGTKHLIIGNIDSHPTISCPLWASTQHYAELSINGVLLVLCHYPFRTWNKMGKKSINLHGHSHGKLKPAPRQYDVGVDAWDLRPVTLETVLRKRR